MPPNAGSGTPAATLRVPLSDARISRWLDGDTLVLTADYPGSCTGSPGGIGGSLPVLLSIRGATASFVTGPLANCDSAGGQVVLAAWPDLSGQVRTPGDCLNLRQRPETDAPVLECLPDGVLLAVIGKDGVPEGRLPVTAPSGNTGWVSAAFVARQ
ncbi:MAG: SH3 domain-containing protein [Chloroflexi bacterium]|nr:SH3 domain-containing protein [Chloroflexota bacterium]